MRTMTPWDSNMWDGCREKNDIWDWPDYSLQQLRGPFREKISSMGEFTDNRPHIPMNGFGRMEMDLCFSSVQLLSCVQLFAIPWTAAHQVSLSIIICSDFGAPQNKVCHCFHCLPIYLPWSDGTRCHDLRFLNLEFQANFITPIKRLFSSSSFSAIKSGIICISETGDISPSSLDSSLWFIQPGISHDVLCIEVK